MTGVEYVIPYPGGGNYVSGYASFDLETGTEEEWRAFLARIDVVSDQPHMDFRARPGRPNSPARAPERFADGTWGWPGYEPPSPDEG